MSKVLARLHDSSFCFLSLAKNIQNVSELSTNTCGVMLLSNKKFAKQKLEDDKSLLSPTFSLKTFQLKRLTASNF